LVEVVYYVKGAPNGEIDDEECNGNVKGISAFAVAENEIVAKE